MGLFYRTIRMIDNGIKPVYVFDGKPPDLKKGVVRCLVDLHGCTSEQRADLDSWPNDTPNEQKLLKRAKKLKRPVSLNFMFLH